MLLETIFQAPTRTAERRILRAAMALGTAAVLAVGVTPIANAATLAAVPSAAVSTIVADPEAEIAALKELKATYFRDVDSKQWLALRDLYTPDAVVDTTGSLGPYFVGRDPFVAFTALTLSLINTRHQGYDPQITLDSDSAADIVWTMQDRLSLAGLVTIHGYGHYTDHYVKVDGKWLVANSKLTRTGFELEFPALQKFLTEFTEVWNSQGPVAALQYTVTAAVTLPVTAAGALLGAALSNFGGPPAKAESIQVPPGAQDPTNPEPPAAAAASLPTRTLALSGAAPTLRVAPVEPAPSAAPATSSRLRGTDATAEKRVEAVESAATQLADDTTSGAANTDSIGETPRTSDDAPKTAEPKSTVEPKKTTEPKDTTEPKKTTEPKDTTEPKKTTEPKDTTTEAKTAATPSV